MNREVTDFPWERLPAVARSDAAAMRRIRTALGRAADPAALAEALSSVLGASVGIVVRSVSSSVEAPEPGRSIYLETPGASVTVAIEPDAAFASFLLGRLLRREPHIVDANAELSAPIRGALAALAVEVARRARCADEMLATRSERFAGRGPSIRASITVDELLYGLTVWASEGANPATVSFRPTVLDDLGDLPVSVPLVAAESLASRREAFDFEPDDVWMPGEGWFAKTETSEAATAARHLLRRGVLAAPSSERGVAVGHSEDGKIVLLGTVVALAADAEDPRRGGDDRTMSEPKDALDAAILDSPVVVRVEIGTVSFTAREWAALRPGDVVETGLRLAEPVVLRVAGREVARGELVNVEGELGVRIRELVPPGRAP